MKRTFWILIAVILTFTAIDANGQRWKLRRYEVDFGVSSVFFHGDIGLAGKPFANSFNGLRAGIGITPRYLLARNMAVSLDLSYLMFGGQDEGESSHGRIYSFNSHVFQHFARFEYYIMGEPGSGGAGIYNKRGMVNNYSRIHLYLYAGAGGLLSSATVKDQDGIEPTENPGYYPGGQYGFGFPVGGGMKFSIDPRWSVGLELGYQFSLTDKLDGYSREGVSQYNDTYYLLSLKAIYRIRNDKNGKPVFNRYYR
ncbi:MAG: hypothetical protein GY790_08885 [Bacteroidetes bacterium]|nr:hypothetical protein [Bacteroidota bacterium]